MQLNTSHPASSNIHQWMDQTKKQRKVRKYSKEQKQQFFDELKCSPSGKGLSHELWKFLIAKGYQATKRFSIEKNPIILKDEAILSAIHKLQNRISKDQAFKTSWVAYYQTIVSNELVNLLRKTVRTSPIDGYNSEEGESFSDFSDNSHESLIDLLKFKKSLDSQKFIDNDILYLLELLEKEMSIKDWKRLSAANRYAAKTRILRETTNAQEIFSIKDIPTSFPIIADKKAITDDAIMVSDNIIPDYIEEKETLPLSLLELYEVGIHCRKEVDDTKKEVADKNSLQKEERQKLKLYTNALLGIYCFDKILQHKPQLFISRYNLCMLKRRLGMTDETINELAVVIQHLDDRPLLPNVKLYKTSTLEFIGEIYMIEKSDSDTALTYYNEADSITPLSSATLFNRAICRYSKDKKLTQLIIEDLTQVYNNEIKQENPERFYMNQIDSSFKRKILIAMMKDSKKVQKLIPLNI